MTEKKYMIFGMILSIFSTVGFMMAMDVHRIVAWGVRLLECLSKWDIDGYVPMLQNEGGCNYSMLINITTAIWELPLFIFDRITGLGLEIAIYAFWFKFFILLVAMLSIYLIGDILSLLEMDRQGQRQMQVFFMASPILQLGSLAFGQIDIIGVLFFLLFFRALLQKNEREMAIFASLGICYKGLIVLLIVPILLLYFTKYPHNIWKNIIYFAICPILVKVLTLPFDGFEEMQKEVNTMYGFGGRFFSTQVEGSSICIFAVCVVCFWSLYLAYANKDCWYDYILMPMACFWVFLFTFFWHPQWVVYALFLVLLLGVMIQKRFIFNLLYFGLNTSYVWYTICNSKWHGSELGGGDIDNNLVWPGMIGTIISWKRGEIVLIKNFGNIISEHVTEATILGRTAFCACVLLLIMIAYNECRSIKNIDRAKESIPKRPFVKMGTSRADAIVFAIQFLPIVLFELLSYVFYVFRIMPM